MAESLEPRRVGELEGETRAWVELSGARLGGDPLNSIRVLSHQPHFVEPFLRWSAALAASPELGIRRHELACLRVAWRYDSAYEWDNHEPVAREAGISDDELTPHARLLGEDQHVVVDRGDPDAVGGGKRRCRPRRCCAC